MTETRDPGDKGRVEEPDQEDEELEDEETDEEE